MSIHQILGTLGADEEAAQSGEERTSFQAKAGSLNEEDLQQCSRQIAPYVAGSSAPSAEPDRDDAVAEACAWDRLFFFPKVEDFQLIGHTCYPASRNEGSAGGCISHVLLRRLRLECPPEQGKSDARQAAEPPSEVEDTALAESAAGQASTATADRAEPTWSVLDGLRLWGARGWIGSDSPDLPRQLPSLNCLSELLAGAQPAITDEVLLSFLKEPGDSPAFVDATGVIPARWRGMEPERRRRWFTRVLCRFLQPDHEPRRSLMVVAEPAVAALMFYGIARLLPAGPLREEISFSTFESDPGSARGSLVATWPSGPAAWDGVEQSSWSGVVVNTLDDLPAEEGEQVENYARCVVADLCERGWEAVDDELAALAAEGVVRCGQLESLMSVEHAVTTLLEQGTLPNENWRSSAAAMSYLRRELVRRVVAMEDPKEGLKAVAGGPAHLAVIDFLTAKPFVPETRKALQVLIRELPPQKLLGLLKLSGVSDDDKVLVLMRHIHGTGELPPGCEFLWDDFAAPSEGPRRPGAVFMGWVIAKLPPKDLKKFCHHIPRDCEPGFVGNVFRLHKHNKIKLESVSAVVRGIDESAVYRFLKGQGSDFLRSYPKEETGLGERLAELLASLPRHPQEFRPMLDLILAGKRLLPDDQHREAAEAWDACRELIPKISKLQDAETGVNASMRIATLVNHCRDLAKAADQAMLLESVDQHMTWTQKRQALLRIAQEMLGGVPLLLKGPWEHEAILDRISTQFHHHRWPTEPLKKDAAPKKEAPKKLVGPEKPSMATVSWPLALGVVLAILLVTAAIVFAVYWMFLGKSSSTTKERPKTREREKSRRERIPRPGMFTLADCGARADVTATLLARLPEYLDRLEKAPGGAWREYSA